MKFGRTDVAPRILAKQSRYFQTINPRALAVFRGYGTGAKAVPKSGIGAVDNLAEFPNNWQPKKRQCKVIIETPKGCRNKFDYEPDYRLFALGGLLPEGLAFPFDFGFIPSTLADDGDPLDVMILMDEPAHVGCLLDVRIIGVIEADQIEEDKRSTNNRLIAVAVHSYSHENVKSIDGIGKSILDQVEEFFVSYNKSRGKKFKVKGRKGPKRAAEILEAGRSLFEKKRQER